MTDDELREFADEHLYYEVEMALWTGPLALRYASPASVEEQIIKNALFELFVTHVRALKEFFYDERKHPDDVIADDYVADPKAWRQARGPVPEVLKVSVRLGRRRLFAEEDLQDMVRRARQVAPSDRRRDGSG